MTNIIFYGDSITDACRDRNALDGTLFSYGFGYVHGVASTLLSESTEYKIINRGISGNRIVDLYSRIKSDVWNLNPDVLSVLVGVNDIWHEFGFGPANGVEIDRFETVYRMMLADTVKRFPNLKIIIMEPFVLKTDVTSPHFDEFSKVKEYAKVAKNIAKDFNAVFVPLQDKIDKMAEKFGATHVLADGVHPSVVGAKLIAEEWVKAYKEKVQPFLATK